MLMLAKEIGWFETLFFQCGIIGWLLWAMNVVAIALIIQFMLMVRRVNILPPMLRAQIQQMFEQQQYREVIDLTENEPSFFSRVMNGALTEAAHGYPAMERAMEEAAEERTTKLLRSIEWLNLMGNVGPMLGLAGTVLGMIMAFMEIQAAGQADVSAVAGPIGLALVTTLLGLIVAIPCLTVFSFLRNRIDALTSEAMVAAQEFISTFRPKDR